jgi:hypothetical protein
MGRSFPPFLPDPSIHPQARSGRTRYRRQLGGIPVADFLTDEEIEACLRSLVEYMATLPEKDAQIIQRGIKAVEQVAHRRGLEDAAKTLDA